MATKSILKDVTIRDRKLAHTFAEALESAKNTKYAAIQMSRRCVEIKGEENKEFFDE